MLQVQQEISATLKRVDGDIGRFASCLEKAKKDMAIEQKGESLKELRLLNTSLRTHKDEVRKLTTQAGAEHPKKSSLAEAKQRLEQEMRKFQELEKCMKAQAVKSAATNEESKKSVETQDGSTPDRASEASPMSTTSEEAAPVIAMFEEKVLVDQLLSPETELSKEFSCKICLAHVVGCGPMLTQCSHLFCGDCLEQWFTFHPGNKTWAQRAQSGSAVPCPVCKEPLHKEQDLKPVCRDGSGGSKFLYQMLSKTKIVCANNPKCSINGNCNWSGDYGSYQEHIHVCQNMQIPGYTPSTPASNVPAVKEMPLDDAPAILESETISVDVPEKVETEAPATAAVVDHDSKAQTTFAQDNELTCLLGSLLELKTTQLVQAALEVETDDTCSTHASEGAGYAEPSEAELSEHVESPVASDTERNVPIVAEAPQYCDNKPAQPLKKRATKKKLVQEAQQACQAAQAAAAQQALQWQIAQQQAVRYQAAQYQMEQFRVAQLVQWQRAQVAQAAYASQVAQMHTKQAMEWQRARSMQQ